VSAEQNHEGGANINKRAKMWCKTLAQSLPHGQCQSWIKRPDTAIGEGPTVTLRHAG
jgi:hypothetical protein